jgi:hypothetical protein
MIRGSRTWTPGIERKSKTDYKHASLFLAIEITETVSVIVVNADSKYQVQWSKIVWPKTLEIESVNFILFLSEKNNLYEDKKILFQTFTTCDTCGLIIMVKRMIVGSSTVVYNECQPERRHDNQCK